MYLKENYFTAENNMEQASIDESRLNDIMKKALIEVFEEEKFVPWICRGCNGRHGTGQCHKRR
jgi:rubrerythrin